MHISNFVNGAMTEIERAHKARVLDEVAPVIEALGHVYICWLEGAREAQFPDVALRAIADTCRTMLIVEDLTERDERFYLLTEVVVMAEMAADKLVTARCKP